MGNDQDINVSYYGSNVDHIGIDERERENYEDSNLNLYSRSVNDVKLGLTYC